MKFVKLIKANKSFNSLLKQKGWKQLVGNNPKGYINALKANCLSSSFVFDNKKVFASYIYRDNKFKEIGVNISETDRKYIIKTYRMKNSNLINADKLKSDLSKTNIKYLDTESVI